MKTPVTGVPKYCQHDVCWWSGTDRTCNKTLINNYHIQIRPLLQVSSTTSPQIAGHELVHHHTFSPPAGTIMTGYLDIFSTWFLWQFLSVTGLCEGNPPVTGGFPSQRASNTENVSIWWRLQGWTKYSRRVTEADINSVVDVSIKI